MLVRKNKRLASEAGNLEDAKMWYCAHGIFYFECDSQDSFLVHENVYLINAVSDEEALARAEKIAANDEDLSEDGHLELNGMKARYRFAGIRKLIEVETDAETTKGHLHSDIEVTYSVLEVDTLSEVQELAKGEMTNTLYRE